MRSQHLCSILVFLSAGGEAQHHRLLKDLYLLDTLFAHCCPSPCVLSYAHECVKFRGGSCSNILFLEEVFRFEKKKKSHLTKKYIMKTVKLK